jgi:DNA-binding Lrp family transcriptional regulator
MSTKRSALRDELDQKLARALINNPSADDEALAKSLGIHKNTVQRRRRALLTEGILAPSLEIRDWGAIGFPLRYRIDIEINAQSLLGGDAGEKRKAARDFDASPADCPEELRPKRPVDTQERMAHYIYSDLLKYVKWRISTGQDHGNGFDNLEDVLIIQDVNILLGHRADLSMIVRASHQSAVLMLVVNGLRRMRGVTSTVSSHEAWSCVDGFL